ncbi:MAG: glycosyltransferase [Candidatus Omnitrophota bacterium]
MKHISVIIPTYNRDKFLKKAIESVLNQTYPDFQLIVVDDGSTDSTKDLLNVYIGKLRHIYQENKGPSAAKNTGIRNSQNQFIAFLDSDDCWHKDKLGIQLKAMQENPQYLISHTQEIWYKNGKLLNQKQKHKKYEGYIFDKCLPICALGMSTIMARRELFSEVGLFDENLPCCEDYDLWLRISARFPVLLIDTPLTLKDGGRPDQVSSIYARGIDKFRIQSIKGLLEKNNLNSQQRELALQELENRCKIYGLGCIKYGRQEEGQAYLDLIKNYNLKY